MKENIKWEPRQGWAEAEMDCSLSEYFSDSLSMPPFNFAEKTEEPFKVQTDSHISTEDEIYTL